VKIERLKRGDGMKENASLWMKMPDDWNVGGIVKDRDSLFFIPTFTGISNTTENSQYILEFKHFSFCVTSRCV
jgi:hypothetical protein